jgi:hypothetical protein
VIAMLAAVPGARAAITIEPGANTVATQRVALDFGDGIGNVERLDSVRWSGTNGAFGANLVSNGGVPGCLIGDPPEQWGAAASVGAPSPVGDGSTGTWTPRGRRSVEIASTRPDSCTADTGPVPVRTRYTFFDAGASASKVRVERRFGFSAGSIDYTSTSLRAYVPHLPGSFRDIVHPNAAGAAPPMTDHPCPAECWAMVWNGTWFAINDPDTNSGVIVLRDPASSLPARLSLDADSHGGVAAAADLAKPAGGWKAPVTETEWLCFYDAGTWPTAERASGTLPAGCTIQAVPISTVPPAISGTARVGGELVATGGAFDYATDARSFQWLRCSGSACAPIAGATADRHTATPADEGATLRVDVTATAPGGESDTATATSAVVAPGPPTITAAPTISGEVRQDEVVTASTGTWSGAPTSFAYQWLNCSVTDPTNCSPVAGATGSTYRLARDDAGSAMRVRVTATNSVGSSRPADSAPTGAVLPFVIRAALQPSPATSCTGLPVTLDASGSKSPGGPIVRYRFESQNLPELVVFASAFAGPTVVDDYLKATPKTVLYDGINPAPSITFNWNRQVGPEAEVKFLQVKLGDYVRDSAIITLTVTDKAGGTATKLARVGFAQMFSSKPRAGCPKLLVDKVRSFRLLSPTATKTTVTAEIPCRGLVNCAVSYKLSAVASRTPIGRAARARQTTIATSGLVEIPAGQKKKVTTKLTSAGRTLLRKRTKATLAITSVTPTGKRVTQKLKVTLGGKKR